MATASSSRKIKLLGRCLEFVTLYLILFFKKVYFFLEVTKKTPTFALALRNKQYGDPLAQLVEHNTFNVGVLGSSPKRITRIPAESQGTFLTKLKQEEVFTVVKSSFSV